MRIANIESMASILLVDDDADGREVLARFLTKSGYAVRAARNGREALVAVATTLPDVIILDVVMPEMNGVEFLGVVRSYLRWATLPVILLTGHPEGPDIDRAKEMGVKCVFLKAEYKLPELLACVEALRTDPSAGCSRAE